jgi:hypothetical protein
MIGGLVSQSPSFLPSDRYMCERLIHLPWLEPDGSGARSPQLRKTVQGVADVAESDEAEDRGTDEEGEDPEQERGVPDVGAVVPNLLRGLLLFHRLCDRREELLVRLRLAEPLQQELGAFDLTHGREHLSQQDDLTHDLGGEQHLLAACA